MALYRVKQFFWALFSKINSSDIDFINSYLNQVETDLFNKLHVNEQKHSIRVAKDVLNEYTFRNSELKMKESVLVKAGILHDIGKTQGKINIFEKSILVIVNKLSKGRIKKMSCIKKIKLFYNHAEIGYEILREYDYDERFLYIIKNHHNYSIKNDFELNLLMICDNRN